MDYTALFGPLIISLVPIITAFVKRVIPPQWGVFIPVMATALGPLLEWVSTFVTGRAADPKYGMLYGMAGVALREIIDQAKQAGKLTAPK